MKSHLLTSHEKFFFLKKKKTPRFGSSHAHAHTRLSVFTLLYHGSILLRFSEDMASIYLACRRLRLLRTRRVLTKR